MTFTELAAAKVNLTLRVLGRRPDGYHELESLVAFAGFGDEVTLEVSEPLSLEVTGPFAPAIEGENLVATTLALLSKLKPRLALGKVTLTKQLPVAAGLGGGSADVAALLRCVGRANPSVADRFDWPAIAASIGADVSVCLMSQCAFITGIGDRVEPIAGYPPLCALLVNPGLPLRTRAVFEALGARPVEGNAGGRNAIEPLPTAGALLSYLQRQNNDLEPPAARLLPAVADVLAALRASPACLLARMTGSGPTCFGIYPTPSAAESAARTIAAAAPAWWLRTTQLS
jgi:4-diphosphocytidyl-2-C-methyl-D-erythritol kinase